MANITFRWEGHLRHEYVTLIVADIAISTERHCTLPLRHIVHTLRRHVIVRYTYYYLACLSYATAMMALIDECQRDTHTLMILRAIRLLLSAAYVCYFCRRITLLILRFRFMPPLAALRFRYRFLLRLF